MFELEISKKKVPGKGWWLSKSKKQQYPMEADSGKQTLQT